eukprot:XP_011663885.1 PREDICTED: pollen-specific leucine-rich repeat extensin-like protein 2 [Strongylocentrotus purpuratus]
MTSMRSITSLEGQNSILGSLAVQHSNPPSLGTIPTPHFQPPAPLATPVSSPTPEGATSSSRPTQLVMGGITSSEGPLESDGSGLLSSLQSPDGAFLTSIQGPGLMQQSLIPTANPMVTGPSPANVTTADMNFSALYMHQLHDRSIVLPGSSSLEMQPPQHPMNQSTPWQMELPTDSIDSDDDDHPPQNMPLAPLGQLINTDV